MILYKLSAFFIMVLFSVQSESQPTPSAPYGQCTYFSGFGSVTNYSPRGQAIVVPTGSLAQWNSLASSPPAGVTVTGCVCTEGTYSTWAWFGYPSATVTWVADPSQSYCTADRNGNSGFTYSGYCLRHQEVYSWSCNFYSPGGTCTVTCTTYASGYEDCGGTPQPASGYPPPDNQTCS